MWTIYVVTAELLALTLYAVSNIYLYHKEIKEVQIVIIGAGASGIAAASRLLENGVDDIAIIEAENRIGGRVNTIKLGDGVIDIGGQWVHGEEGNIAFQMAKGHDLLIESITGVPDKFAFIEESGNLIDASTSAKFVRIYEEISESATANLEKNTGSVGQYFEHEYPKKLKEYSLTGSHLEKHFFSWFEKAENVLDASDSWYYTSGYEDVVFQYCKGNQQWAWKNGFGTVLDLLMKKIPDPSKELPVLSKINLNSEVKRIVWDNVPGNKSNKIVVECSDGVTYLADHVIVTVSLGVLKERVHSMFSPALSTNKLNAIKGFNIGTVDKVYLKFPYKWWPENFTDFTFLYPEEKHPCRSKDCWMKDLFLFSSVDNQPLLLCGWITGPAARIMEQLTTEEVKQESVKLLKKFVGKAFNVPVPQPDQIIRSAWYSNPHFRGSYSYHSLETESLGVSAADLAEPILNSEGLPVIMFAGEATHTHYFSTVHGAIETGLREADRVLKFHKS